MKRLLAAISFVFVTVVGIDATPVRAQWAVDFAFGSGGGHHHHHHGGWYGWYGGYYPPPYYNYVYVAPPPVVYAPAPVVQTVVPLSQMQMSSPTISSSSSASTSARTITPPSYQGPGVTIRNPSASGTNLAFVVDNRREVDLGPGEAKPLADKSAYHIEFDRGGDFGTARKNVSEGEYEFVATDRGWDLRRLEASNESDSTPIVRRNALPTTAR